MAHPFFARGRVSRSLGALNVSGRNNIRAPNVEDCNSLFGVFHETFFRAGLGVLESLIKDPSMISFDIIQHHLNPCSNKHNYLHTNPTILPKTSSTQIPQPRLQKPTFSIKTPSIAKLQKESPATARRTSTIGEGPVGPEDP
ncbi:hypothetical protein KM043_003621 [Ampulex compressa]|nr:hypothetical protein KM043_003621 [Ampulex compressa]